MWFMARFEPVRHLCWLVVCLAFCLVARQGLAVGIAPELPDWLKEFHRRSEEDDDLS